MKVAIIILVILGIVFFAGVETFKPKMRASQFDLVITDYIKNGLAGAEARYLGENVPYPKRNEDRLKDLQGFLSKNAAELGINCSKFDVNLQIERTGSPLAPGTINAKIGYNDPSDFIVYQKPNNFNVSVSAAMPPYVVPVSRPIPRPDEDER